MLSRSTPVASIGNSLLLACALWGGLFVSADGGPTQAQAQTYRAPRIMPLGDSLTSSIDGQASYRYWLWRSLAGYGFWTDFVGSQVGVGSSRGPKGFDQNHEGHAGATSADILEGIPVWAQDARPDFVLMLIGATDLERGVPPGEIVKNCVRIIAQLRKVNPRVRVLWAMVPPAPDYDTDAALAFNRASWWLTYQISTSTSPVVPVNMWNGFNAATDTVDGSHPNSLGERKFSNRFQAALLPLLFQFRGY